MKLSLEIVRFIAEEVERQRRGPLQVSWMAEAWNRAMEERALQLAETGTGGHVTILPSLRMIQTWAWKIEREKNDNRSFRSGWVRIGIHVAPSPEEVHALMEKWRDRLADMTPNEAYIEFEHIHPFIDGNGRTGKIIFNWLNDTLDHPVLPVVPPSWGIP